MRTPFESLLHKKYLDKLSQVAVTYTVNFGFHPAPSSRSGTRPVCPPRIPPHPRTLCTGLLPRSGPGVGVYPERLGAFSSPNPSLFNFELLALFTLLALLALSLEGGLEGSSACPVHPACPACPEPRREPRREARREERREQSRRVNLLSLPLLPAVDSKLSAVSCRLFFANSHRITSFAHPHPLTPIESHLCKKTGGGVTLTKSRERWSPCLRATRRNSRNSIPFIALLYNSRTPPGGGIPAPKWKPRPGEIHQRT
jgi:hypothetical protein